MAVEERAKYIFGVADSSKESADICVVGDQRTETTTDDNNRSSIYNKHGRHFTKNARRFPHLLMSCILIFSILCILSTQVHAISSRHRQHRKHRHQTYSPKYKDRRPATPVVGVDGIDIIKEIGRQSTNQTVKRVSLRAVQLSEGFHGRISRKSMKSLLRKSSRTFSLLLYGDISASDGTQATLISVHSEGRELPLLQVLLDTSNQSLIVRYQGERSYQRINIHGFIPMTSEDISEIQSHPKSPWDQLLFTFGLNELRIVVDCFPEKIIPLRQKMAIFDGHKLFFFGHDKKKKNYLEGLVYKAKLYNHIIKGFPWTCPKADDSGFSSLTLTERVATLQRQVEQLVVVVNSIQLQNTKMAQHIAQLETCECLPKCTYNGKTFGDKETWQPDTCTLCHCQEGKPDCKVRADIPGCSEPCSSSPCKHAGSCVGNESNGTFKCLCPAPFSGTLCETWINPYVWPADPGYCHETYEAYYFDRNKNQCLVFNYTGCGGNVNNFKSLEECQKNTLFGACCIYQYSIKREDIIKGRQSVQKSCQVLSVSACRKFHRHSNNPYEEQEVVGFYPGLSCEDARYPLNNSNPVIVKEKFCHLLGHSQIEVGKEITIGCKNCICMPGGKLKCKCSDLILRKEIRDFTWEEMTKLQQAISQLRLSGIDNIWNKYRDLYMVHHMHSHGGAFYLPWHRQFLQLVELQLKEIDCHVTLPYFDFTTDAANFSEAIIWQPNFFGGDGWGWCVPDHAFGDSNAWKPCLKRNFSHIVEVPTMLDVAAAISKTDFIEMSELLETFAAYIHSFVGGDMSTTAMAYDPLFYIIQTYIDRLYATWQKMGHNKFKFPAAYGNIPMVPFNTAPLDVLDLENDLCVTYSPPGKGRPCNKTAHLHVSELSAVEKNPNIHVKIISRSGYDQFGYNSRGFDRRGINKFGYNYHGVNREGFDQEGYDLAGYNRYGFDRDGYDRDGFNVSGRDRDDKLDTSLIFEKQYLPHRHCLNRKGLTKDGFDRYGFDIYGYDLENCNYSFKGPFTTLLMHRVWEILHTQSHEFLVTLTKTCQPLKQLPNVWYKQFWMEPHEAFVVDLIKSDVPLQSESNILSQRICFSIEPYVSPCPCNRVTTCTINLCLDAECPSYPQANCFVDVCNECSPVWYLKGRIVDCETVRDYCHPNPCQHGATCIQSVWPAEPWLVSCKCPPGYEGDHCQYKSKEICYLPLQKGSCSRNVSRWYFDFHRSKCVQFDYSGCGGNANLFETLTDCQKKCVVGACCYRQQLNPAVTIGFGPDGYDKYGFNAKGYNQLRKIFNAKTGMKMGINRFKKNGYDWHGYDKNGFNSVGYDRLGYNSEGYDPFGFNMTGYSREGEFDGMIDYDDDGYDEEGYNRAGFNCEGVNRDGLDIYGRHAGFKYTCMRTTRKRCQHLETEDDVQIVRFSPGKKCEDVSCKPNCMCWFNNQFHRIWDDFNVGCEKFQCHLGGFSEMNSCQKHLQRKEIRDMSFDEIKRYQLVIQNLQHEKRNGKSVWFEFAEMYSEYIPQASGNPLFLPWHRYFLFMVEKLMQDVECGVVIPYYDWTLDIGVLNKSVIWSSKFFGGNGENGTDCVRYHPFKSYHPPYWTPCLRRHFNSSVHLPDAIHVYLALQESTFSDFSAYMESMLHLFQMWVGGHMDSPLSAYDPLFYSHVAFIDKLWDDWQRSHKKGLLRFPPNFRYVPMEPFKVTPDDVLDCKKQICITYLNLPFGSPCNQTKIKTYGYDSDSYDRHGFDKNGYDKDGFDVHGINIDGYIDLRGIYNNEGFDKEGFSRQGFDSMGYDKDLFFKDGYNSDGFDVAGYDRSGHNRYGFSRIKTNVFSEHVSTFRKNEFNELGLNNLGFNNKGFDIFGFDKDGFNRFGCNYYFNGPFYIIIYQSLKNKLSEIKSMHSLINIPRLCPAVSQLPQWMYKVYWLNRQKNIPEVLAIMALDRLKNPYSFDDVFDKIWVPPVPDPRFCLETNFFSKCPLGHAPVKCSSDLCFDTICPGISGAICRVNYCGTCSVEWYDAHSGDVVECQGCKDEHNRHRPDKTSWINSECNNCTCKSDFIDCQPVLCPEVSCLFPATATGECCPSCKVGCNYDENFHALNSSFTPSTDPCQTCSCQKGNVFCEEKVCTSLDSCHTPVVLANECCPTCMDCGQHPNGSQWIEGHCQHCVCLNGTVKCEQKVCPSIECKYPVLPDGECCPRCHDCLVDEKIVLNDDVFTLSGNGCQECYCSQGDILCKTVDSCDKLDCRNVITPKGKCCPQCKGCKEDHMSYSYGDIVPSNNTCTNCMCIEGIVLCREKQCPKLECPRSRNITGQCCPQCEPFCEFKGTVFSEGETVKDSNDPCLQCSCQVKEEINSVGEHHLVPSIQCLYIKDQCKPTECSHPARMPDQCCPVCENCYYLRRIFYNNQSFTLPDGDPCKVCTCKDGKVSCKRKQCPFLNCSNPMQLPNQCCPVCESGCHSERGSYYLEGQNFDDPEDDCRTCICLNRQIICRVKECPPISCSHPARETNRCCPTCDFCEYDRRIFRDKQRFFDPRLPTRTCECLAGSVVCDADGSTCSYEGKTYKEAEVFLSHNECEECICQNSQVTCQSVSCPDLQCQHPANTDGCCPSCYNCTFSGNNFQNKEVFQNPQDTCSTCQCQEGTVVCNKKFCPTLHCTHPNQEPGECCQSCQNCNYFSQTYRDSKVFANPENPCETCHCEKGSVRCQTSQCPPVSCTHPSKQNTCCPKCASCDFDGHEIQDRQKFAHPADECQICECMEGSVICTQKECQPVTCNNPVINSCCPVCADCLYEGRTLRNQQRFAHETDSCQICQCLDGNIHCTVEKCPDVECTHPAKKHCCKECHDCSYNGTEYANNMVFRDPINPCQRCICKDGNINCQERQCPQVQCQNPNIIDCCPVCEDCVYNNQVIKSGRTIPHEQDECQVCTCQSGDLHCTRKGCKEVTCSHPVSRNCCQECSDCKWNATYVVSNGGQVLDELQCKICECHNGDLYCVAKDCPVTRCSHPVKQKCCSVCDDCFVNGEIIPNGKQQQIGEDNPCRVCKCQNGSFECHSKSCPQLSTCTNPVIRDCCPECFNCMYGGQEWLNLSNFTDPQDMCGECLCEDGNVSCHRMSCAQPDCDNPIRVAGQCCPACPDACEYNGQVYENGENFADASDQCKECACLAGHVNCSSLQCNPVTCTHPSTDKCCDVCYDCVYEGNSISNGHSFKKDACQTCTCRNGNVICIKESCPPLNCPLAERLPGQCCAQCQECTYKDRSYKNGAMWFSDDDSCTSCICHDGSVTCLELQCIVPCSNYVEEPDQCCPVCPSCTHQGITYQEGAQFNLNSDPCEPCICENGKLKCARLSCPDMTMCPEFLLVDPQPGFCCPTCSGFSTQCTAEHVGEITQPKPEDLCLHCKCEESLSWVCFTDICPVPTCPLSLQKRVEGTCCAICPACYYDLEDKFYEDGETWKDVDNPCVICQCIEQRIQCNMQECPTVNCSFGEEKTRVDGQCCETCIPANTTACFHNGQTRRNGEIWSVDECTKCACVEGRPACNTQTCPLSANCDTEEEPFVRPGYCCPTCLAKPSTCILYGNNHYRTFDGANIHFQGACNYIMATNCVNNDFMVEVQHGSSYGTSPQNLTVRFAGLEINLIPNNGITVDGVYTELPFGHNNDVFVEKINRNLLLQTSTGMKLVWNGEGFVELQISQTYQRKTCGLCGNFNGSPDDDLLTTDGKQTSSHDIFANSWKTSIQPEESCEETANVHPCSEVSPRLKTLVESKCDIIKSSVFSKCHKAVPPEPFYFSCVHDMCACTSKSECLCDILQIYAHECAKTNIRLNWISQTNCLSNCEEEKGFIFDDCASPCQRTCDNSDSNGKPLNSCFKPCVSGCQCPSSKVLHDGYCIKASECPKD
ncbi:chordin isoform X2 [Octopus vulgaris]|uniref:Chordin isoform X2 n=1 Tax=Octopus vulgaris TaxID=6645 RepID=A0AA36F0Z4_OCTVU|nr:chordin isoform X2 [Octopus vulgaris]